MVGNTASAIDRAEINVHSGYYQIFSHWVIRRESNSRSVDCSLPREIKVSKRCRFTDVNRGTITSFLQAGID